MEFVRHEPITRTPGPLKLSPRERAILTLMVEGFESKEIAYRLEISHGTVKVYVSKMLHKFGFKNRVDAAVKFVTGQVQ